MVNRWNVPSKPIFLTAYLLLAGVLSALVFRLGAPDSLLILLVAPLGIASAAYPNRFYLWLLPICLAGIAWHEYQGEAPLVSLVANILVDSLLAFVMCEALYRLSAQRNQRAEALHRSEERFAAAFNASPVASAISRLDDGTFIDVNDSYLRLLGLIREEVLGKTSLELSVWSSTVSRTEAVERLKRDGAIDDMEMQLATRSGGVLDTLVAWRLITLNDVPCILTHVVDVSGRRQAERALRDSEEKYRTVFETSPLGLGIVDRDGKLLTFNDAVLRMGGYTREDILQIGTVQALYYDPKVREEVLAQMQKTGMVTRAPVPFKRKDGTPFDALLTIRPITIEGQPCVYAVVEDITERKQREQQIQDLLEAEQSARQMAEALYAANAALTRSLDLEIVLPTLLDQLRALVSYDSANVMLMNEAGLLTLHALHGYEDFTDAASVRQIVINPRDERPLREVLKARSLLISDTAQYDGWAIHPETPYVRSWIGVPLVVGDKVIGLFSIDKAEPGAFTQEHLHKVEALAAQASVAIKNARLVESERQQLRLAQTLQRVGTLLTAEMGLADVLERLFDLLAEVVPFDSVSVQLADDSGSLRLAAGRGFPDFEKVKSSHSDRISGHWKIGGPQRDRVSAQIVPDVTHDPDWFGLPGTEYIRAWIGAPLRVKGRFIGVLNVDSATPDSYDRAIADTVSAFASQAAIAIENARLSDAIQRRNKTLTALRRVTRRSVPERDRNRFLQAIAEALAEEFAYPIVEIMLGDDATHEMVMVGFAGLLPPELRASQFIERQPYGRGIFGWVMQHGQPRLSRHVQSDPDYISPPGGSLEGCLLAVPIVQHGNIIGVISVSTSEPDGLDELDQEALVELADELALNLENLALFEAQVEVAQDNAYLLTESELRSRRLAILNEITRIGATATDLQAMLDQIVRATAVLIGADETHITLWNKDARETIGMAAHGPLRDQFLSMPTIPGEHTMTAAVIDAGRTVTMTDDLRSLVDPDIFERFPFPSTIGVPLRVEGQDFGALLISFLASHAFTADEIGWAERAAELIALAIAKAQAYALLEERVRARTAELNAANERLTKLSRLKDEFVSNVSHELRTPISSIKLYHHLLTLRPDRQADYLDYLDRETRRLERIVEDLLMLSRLDNDRVRLVMQPLDLNQIAGQYVTDRAALAEDRGLSLIFSGKTRLPSVQGDPALIGQALSVIMTNAISYTPPGGAIRVSTATRRKGGRRWATLSVADSGPGIPEGELPSLFERFFRGRTGTTSRLPGTGLGLSIALGIVEQHGGHISVEGGGAPGQGATFTLWLPEPDDK